MSQKNVLDIFNAVVAQKISKPDLSLAHLGVVTDFKITPAIRAIIEEKYQPLPINTLFSREERMNDKAINLLEKQFLHYFEVYGLGMPGLFDLVQTNGQIIKAVYISAISTEELADKVRTLIYANAPVKNVEPIVAIIKAYNIVYDIDLIRNNELRVRMFNEEKDTFSNGDDAVRYIVYKATSEMLVIKNKKQIEAVRTYSVPVKFLEKHAIVLSQVFNRFKPIILALKNKNTASVINKISRLSKENHKPVYEGFNKRFISEGIAAIAGNTFSKFEKNVNKLSIRDKFKMLNLIEYKRKGFTVDSFVIRNGTVHIERNRPVLNPYDLDLIQEVVINSLKIDFSRLKNKNILLDERVDYGLPVSRKQTFGNLPFGTVVTVSGNMSSGIYWKNEWGARDLDLSSIDLNGNRIGWGGYSGYGSVRNGDMIFSGDVTHAENGAMEFVTSSSQTFGLFVNIFAGENNADFELVVGSTTDKQWITDTVVRERSTLNGRGSVIGFVEGNKFKIFQGKLNDRHANFGETNPVLSRATVNMWTVSLLLDAVDIYYDVSVDENKTYDFDLSYNSFSIDKLEELLLN